MTLAEVVRTARLKRKWTMRDLEKKTGVHNSMIAHIESGRTVDPLFSTVARLCKALRVNMSKIDAPAKTGA
jgi:transcriptional regulator with XRE-family HTH domain